MSHQPAAEAPEEPKASKKPEAPQPPRVGVAALVPNEKGQYVYGERIGKHGGDTWALPGGHLEHGETYFACAERETLEETGLEVKALRLVTVTNDIFEDGRHYITLFVLCEKKDATKEAQLIEEDKCRGWQLIGWDELKRWAAHHGDSTGPYAGKELFLPMIHMLEQVDEI